MSFNFSLIEQKLVLFENCVSQAILLMGNHQEEQTPKFKIAAVRLAGLITLILIHSYSRFVIQFTSLTT